MLSNLRSHVANNVVGYVAVFLALGGTSYAAATGSIGSRAIKNNSVRSKDVRNKTIRSRDMHRGSVTSRVVKNGSLLSGDFKAGELLAGPTGPTGPAGPTGPTGGRGAVGTARGYAHVLPAGPTLDPAFRKNFTAVTRVAPGQYCLTPAAGINPATSPLMATVDWNGTSNPEGDASAMWNPGSASCGGGNNGFKVMTERATGPAAAGLVNDVAFVVMVP
jgi:hypothetical protein